VPDYIAGERCSERGENESQRICGGPLRHQRFLRYSEEPFEQEEQAYTGRFVVRFGDGLSNKEIAFELRVTGRTVKAHRQAVMRKLKVDSVALLVRKVYGLLETEPQITIPIFNY